MNIEMLGIDTIYPYEKNPRRIPIEAIEKVAKSLQAYGWQQPIVVDKDMVVVVGHTRLQAAKSLGHKEVPVLVAENLTKEQAAGYRLADNRASTETDWDLPELRDEILALSELDFDLSDTLFDKNELTKLLEFSLEDKDDRYADGEKGSMAENFVAPPFSILDTRQRYWQERKAMWNANIGDQGESREGTLASEKNIMGEFGSVSILDACLAEIVVRWFGIPKGNVFDCFAGDTVFGYVASSLGMQFAGIELREEQARLNNERVRKDDLSAVYHNDDAMNMDTYINDGEWDLFFSCPPYADLEVYSDKPNDLSNMSHDEFFNVYKTCLQKTYAKLKPNRFAVVVTSEVRSKKGGYISLVPETIRFMVEAGYSFWNDIILINTAGTLPLRAGRYMHTGRKVGRMHQNVLVFYKGDPKAIKNEFGEVQGGFREEDADEQL